MHPLVKATPVVAVFAALGATALPHAIPVGANTYRPQASASVAMPLVPCPKRALVLASGQPCIALPAERDATGGARERMLSREPASPSLRQELASSLVARLPDRPRAYSSYQLPIAATEQVTGPDEPPAGAEREFGIRVAAERGQPALLVDLEGQSGSAEVVAVGELYGITVVTRHRVLRTTGTADYLAIYGRLERPGPSVVAGATLGPLAVVGFVGGDPAHLYLELRELREPLPPTVSHLSDLVRPAMSVAVDARNALPLRR